MATKATGKLVVEMTSDELKLLRGMQKVIGQTVKMEAGFGKAKRSAKTMGDTGAKSMTSLKSSMVAVAAAGGAIALAMRSAQQEGNEAAMALGEVSGGLRSILQITKDLAEFKAHKALNVKLQNIGGFTRAEAQDFSFDLSSQGVSREEIESLATLLLIEKDPRSLALGAVKLKKIFPKVLKDQSIPDLVGKLLVAGKESPVTAGALANLAAEPLALSKPLGFAPSDVLAAVALGAGAAATPEKGRTNIKGIFSAMLKEANVDRFAGKGLFEGIEHIQGLPAKERRKILGGSQEALLGFDLISSQLATMRALSVAVKAAGNEVVDATVARSLKDPELTAVLVARRAAQRREQALAVFGRGELRQDAMFDTANTMVLERTRGPFGVAMRGIVHTANTLLDLFDTSPDFNAGVLGAILPMPSGPAIERLLESVRPNLEAEVDRALERRNEEFKAMHDTLKEIRENTRKTAVGVEAPAGLAPVGADDPDRALSRGRGGPIGGF